MKKLTSTEIKENLKALPGWKFENDCISKSFEFKNFNENFAFMTRIALIAEKLNHHPEWKGGYKNLSIYLSTHDVIGISELDFTFAKEIEKLLDLK